MGRNKKYKVKNNPNSIDLCEDIDKQPVAFANYFNCEITKITAFKLKLTPEVLEAIEECKKTQEQILSLKAVDWSKLGETYITVFD